MEEKEELKEVKKEVVTGTGSIFDFLYGEAEKPKELLVRVSTRIPYDFKIRPLTLEEHKAFQKKASKIKISGKKREVSFDQMEYYIDSVLACCLEPNFNDSSNVKKAGCVTPEMLLSKLLLPGEIITLGSKITDISGFEEDINDDIEEAKN